MIKIYSYRQNIFRSDPAIIYRLQRVHSLQLLGMIQAFVYTLLLADVYFGSAIAYVCSVKEKILYATCGSLYGRK
ncbi:hypothetical protein JYQ62_30170 [Nostoc sp. UHCC 0702]|nr:hypothetical protein JYQ62_30170 [Nostoc sp. UHCC 0702]